MSQDHERREEGEDTEAVLERALARLGLLAEVSSALGSSLQSIEVLQRLARLLVPHLADWCVTDLIDSDGHVRRASLVHHDPDVDVEEHLDFDLPNLDPLAGTPLERALTGEGPLLVQEFRSGTTPLGRAHQQLGDILGADTEILMPLRARRRVLGVLALVRTDPARRLTTDDFGLVEEVARRAALALDNARLYAEQRDTARNFQRALLPSLPSVDHLRMAARYVPAHTGAEVGGDWYDSFLLPDGATTLVVGDISGHDLQAAVEMSQLRSMLRALAWDHQEPPSAIMRRLDGLLQYMSDTQTATALYGRVEDSGEESWIFRWSNAGHPPPLLVTAGGETTFLTAGQSLLLGVDDTLLRPDSTEELPPDSTLLLYSDGLIERRGESLDRGMVRLRQQATLLAQDPIGEFCDGLIDGILSASNDDDVVLLALRLPSADSAADSENG